MERSATITRSDWGVSYAAPFPVGDEVRLSVEVEGIRE
jgi:polyisoprenoid-binding protein YceI